MQNRSMRGALYGILAASIWGSMYVVSDVVLQIIPPFTLLTLRVGLGLIALLVIYARTTSLSMPTRPIIVRILLVGLVGFGVSLGAQFLGTDKSTAVNGALVTSASPAFIVLFAVLILREKLSALRLLAIVLASLGVLVILDPAQADFSSETFVGDMFLALAAVSWGLYSVLVKQVSTQFALDTLVVTIICFVGGLIFSIPASLIELTSRPIGDVDAGIVVGVLYLGIVSTAVAMWLWNRAFVLVSATVASLFFFAQPLTGAVLAGIFLGQSMTAGLWVGGGLIVLGVLLSLWRNPKNTKNDTST
jgi:drug/metabolite transporter (DMT)-like permease